MNTTEKPGATYARTLEIFGLVTTYDVRPVTLNRISMHGVYENGILHAAFLIDEHAARYVDLMAGR